MFICLHYKLNVMFIVPVLFIFIVDNFASSTSCIRCFFASHIFLSSRLSLAGRFPLLFAGAGFFTFFFLFFFFFIFPLTPLDFLAVNNVSGFVYFLLLFSGNMGVCQSLFRSCMSNTFCNNISINSCLLFFRDVRFSEGMAHNIFSYNFPHLLENVCNFVFLNWSSLKPNFLCLSIRPFSSFACIIVRHRLNISSRK